MTHELLHQLSTELDHFNTLEPSSPTQAIADAYTQIMGTVQAMMLSSDDPDAHARAWSLLKDDAYKDLANVEEGKTDAFDDLSVKINQVGKLLLQP